MGRRRTAPTWNAAGILGPHHGLAGSPSPGTTISLRASRCPLAVFASPDTVGAMDVGRRVREARTKAGLGLSDVARVLGLSASAVSRLETGKRSISAFELGLLHNAFGWDPRDLLGIERPRTKVEIAARLRSADGDASHAGKRAARLIEIDALLDDLGMDPKARSLATFGPFLPPLSETMAITHGERLAAEVRERAQLAGPVVDLFDLAEGMLGIDVLMCPLDGSCDGIVATGARFALVVVDNSPGVIGARRRFTLAHEIAHALFDDVRNAVRYENEEQDVLVELRADRFAAALLMPEDGLRATCGSQPSPVELVHAMVTFGVSWSALRKRLEQLDVAVPAEFAELEPEELFARAGRDMDLQNLKRGDADSSVRMPSRLGRRIRQAYQDAWIGAAVVGAAYGVEGDELEKLLASMPRTRPVPEPAR